MPQQGVLGKTGQGNALSWAAAVGLPVPVLALLPSVLKAAAKTST